MRAPNWLWGRLLDKVKKKGEKELSDFEKKPEAQTDAYLTMEELNVIADGMRGVLGGSDFSKKGVARKVLGLKSFAKVAALCPDWDRQDG